VDKDGLETLVTFNQLTQLMAWNFLNFNCHAKFRSYIQQKHLFNPLPAIMLSSTQILIPPCRAKRFKALFHRRWNVQILWSPEIQ
jgi:hypothetical protein